MKVFFKGFLKGFLIILPLLIILALPIPEELSYKYAILSTLISLVSVSYFISRYKLPKYWLLGSLYMGIFIIPFVFGMVEKIKFSHQGLS